jgi:hypothetical protein
MSEADLYSEDTARALEAHDSFTDMRTELTILRAQNAELLEALKRLLAYTNGFTQCGAGILTAPDQARSAIRRAEEGK